MAEEEVNVIVFGHPGSGKSTIIGKVLELGGLLSEEQIQNYKNRSKDDSQMEVKSDWYRNYVKAARRKPTFARTFYQSQRRKFMFLEFQSDEDYIPKLMMKTKIATVGVLVLSGVSRDNDDNLEATQTRKYIQLFRAICGLPGTVFHVASKLIVLINKNDVEDHRFKFHNSGICGLLEHYGFDTSKVEIISVSSHSAEDMRSFLDRLSALVASEDYCLKPEDCGTPRRDAKDSFFKEMWDKLLITDVDLDVNSHDKSLWRERAKALYAGCNLLEEDVSLEASRIIKMACKAAEKAIDDVDDILLSLILSHGQYENGNYPMAIKHFEKAKVLASKDKNLEDKIGSYLLLGEIRVKEAKELRAAKNRRNNQQKVEIKVEKSDAKEVEEAKELEEAETNVVQDKLEDLGIPQKIDKISANSCSTYLIDSEKRDTLYSGRRMISSSGSSKKAFIPIELSELQDYEYLESLGFQHPNVLALNDITKGVIGGDILVLLVVEDVNTINWFFSDMFRKFLEDNKFSVELIRTKWSAEEQDTFMKSWWDLIAEDFQIIFGDVVNGLLYLYSLGMPSGGLRDHIYVSGDKRGRILPARDKKKTYEDDIADLVKIMMDVIYQPWLQLRAKKKSDYLPPELEHFLSFVKQEKLSNVSAAWLIDQPYFWSSPKRVNFMRKLRKCIQKPSIYFSDLDTAVRDMMDMEFKKGARWFENLEDPMLQEIFKAGGQGTVKAYQANGDIVRFFAAICSHANEKNLCGLKPVEDEVYEKIFRSHFPRIYTCLMDFLYDYLSWDRFINITSSEAMEWFLSSSDV